MPIYNWMKDVKITPFDVLDGEGVLHKHVIEVDSDTGDLLFWERNSQGRISRNQKKIPLPIQLKPKAKDSA